MILVCGEALIGAGDAFGAGLLAWLHDHDHLDRAPLRSLDEASLRAAVTYPTAVAACTCTRTGADPPWRHELDRGAP